MPRHSCCCGCNHCFNCENGGQIQERPGAGGLEGTADIRINRLLVNYTGFDFDCAASGFNKIPPQIEHGYHLLDGTAEDGTCFGTYSERCFDGSVNTGGITFLSRPRYDGPDPTTIPPSIFSVPWQSVTYLQGPNTYFGYNCSSESGTFRILPSGTAATGISPCVSGVQPTIECVGSGSAQFCLSGSVGGSCTGVFDCAVFCKCFAPQYNTAEYNMTLAGMCGAISSFNGTKALSPHLVSQTYCTGVIIYPAAYPFDSIGKGTVLGAANERLLLSNCTSGDVYWESNCDGRVAGSGTPSGAGTYENWTGFDFWNCTNINVSGGGYTYNGTAPPGITDIDCVGTWLHVWTFGISNIKCSGESYTLGSGNVSITSTLQSPPPACSETSKVWTCSGVTVQIQCQS